MDRANPSPADVPSSVPTASSAMPPPSTTPTPGLAGVPDTQVAQSVSFPTPYGAEGQQSSDRQFQREATMSQQPQPSPAEHPPSRQTVNTDGAAPQRPQQPAPAAATHETLATSGARPTTDSTLAGLSTDMHQRSSPPTPPRQPLPQIRTARSAMASSMEKLEDSDTLSGLGINELHRDSAARTTQPLPVLPPVRLMDSGMPRRQRTLDGHGSGLGHHPSTRRSGIDWIVPVEEKVRCFS